MSLCFNHWAEDKKWMHNANELVLLDAGYSCFKLSQNPAGGQEEHVFTETHHLTCEDKRFIKKKGLERLVCERVYTCTLSSAEVCNP